MGTSLLKWFNLYGTIRKYKIIIVQISDAFLYAFLPVDSKLSLHDLLAN
jgi:hypothetical protein